MVSFTLAYGNLRALSQRKMAGAAETSFMECHGELKLACDLKFPVVDVWSLLGDLGECKAWSLVTHFGGW